jgi:hypothetical protein
MMMKNLLSFQVGNDEINNKTVLLNDIMILREKNGVKKIEILYIFHQIKEFFFCLVGDVVEKIRR